MMHTGLLTGVLGCLILLAAPAGAATLTLQLVPTSSTQVGPGGSVNYEVRGSLSGEDGNLGLATFGFDLLTDTGLGQAAASPGGGLNGKFSEPNGYTDPGGFGGTAQDDDLLTIGGAQNTIGNDGISPNPPVPAGTVQLGVASTGYVVLASGHITLPATLGTYTVSLANAFAGQITGGSGPYTVAIANTDIPTASASFRVTVQYMVHIVRTGTGYATIQAALNAAASSDTIELQPSTYYENLVFPATGVTNLVLKSLDGSFENAPNTIIDGSLNPLSVIRGYGNPTIRGLTIQGGRGVYGGGIRLQGAGLVENCYIRNNTASVRGGGMWDNYYGAASHCLVEGNTVTGGDGGGVYGNWTLSDCKILNNTASGSGGGICGFQLVERCTIDGNHATNGGAVAGGSNVPVRDCLIARNTASSNGGGFDGGHAIVSNCTIVANSAGAYGGGARSLDLTFNNCIFWYNSAADGCGAQWAILPDSDMYLNYCDVGPGTYQAGWLNSNLNNISSDPMFVYIDPLGIDSNYHLTEDSPCVNTGNPAYAVQGETDLDGLPRQNGVVDRGAYER